MPCDLTLAVQILPVAYTNHLHMNSGLLHAGLLLCCRSGASSLPLENGLYILHKKRVSKYII